MRPSKDQRKHQVKVACDALVSEGFKAEHITCDDVADKLVELGYGKGSRNPIVRYKREWLEQQVDPTNSTIDNARAGYEMRLTSVVQRIMDEVYEASEEEAENKCKDIEAGWSLKYRELEAEYQSHKSEHQKIVNKYHEITVKLRESTSELTQQKADILRLNKEWATERTRAEGFEQQLLETKTGYERRIKSLEEDKQAMTKERQDKEQQWRDDLNSAIEANEKARHQYMVDIDQLETRFKKTEKRAMAAETQVERLTADHKEVKRELGEQQKINKQLQAELNHQKTTLSELRETNTRQDEAIKQVRDQRVELQHENRVQMSQIIALREENAALTEKLHQAQLMIQRLQVHERTALTE